MGIFHTTIERSGNITIFAYEKTPELLLALDAWNTNKKDLGAISPSLKGGE